MKEGAILWMLVFAGPVAWFVALGVNFAFSTRVCSGPWLSAPVAVWLLALVASGASGTVLWNRFRGMHQSQPAASQAYRIVAIAGTILSFAFVVVILAESIPNVMLRNCQ